ncbi:MAG: tRNA 2-selenouridine(34) synthase MnmH [Rhodocyclales bacterium]|nr:tRNA 2-selenouridine(34) synthase MnmH [Rhodocyclales bacterium]
MSERLPKGLATVAQLGEFDDIIDARSPGEYADDHLPGAISCPVLSDAERARVGTIYKQVSPFEAKKLGAVLVARNIARHIEENFLAKPREWKPLVYCWRGGKRSGAFCHILREVGWNAHRLDGGYKAWRRQVLDDLEFLPGRFRFQVISGATGSAKSRILEALGAHGAQILHLEELAAHKGSLLGNLPDAPQPSQKAFESRLHAALGALDPQRPVFTEAESRRIGAVHLPESLIAAIRAAPCLRIDATLAARVEFLLRDYAYFLTDPIRLAGQLELLRSLQSGERVERWLAFVAQQNFPDLVAELLEAHYDPLYQRSQTKNFSAYGAAPSFATADLSPTGIEQVAQDIMASLAPA